jgi:hypothetical protein
MLDAYREAADSSYLKYGSIGFFFCEIKADVNNPFFFSAWNFSLLSHDRRH